MLTHRGVKLCEVPGRDTDTDRCPEPDSRVGPSTPFDKQSWNFRSLQLVRQDEMKPLDHTTPMDTSGVSVSMLEIYKEMYGNIEESWYRKCGVFVLPPLGVWARVPRSGVITSGVRVELGFAMCSL